MGAPIGSKPKTLLTVEDYFQYNREFSIYLFREESTSFDELTTTEAGRAAFVRFCQKYNNGELERPYYDRKFPNAVIDESKTTQHAWSFNYKSPSEQTALQSLQGAVRKQTEYSNTTSITDTGLNATACTVIQNPNTEDDNRRKGRKTDAERLEERRVHRRLKEQVRVTNEELMGGPKDYKERRREKKKEYGERLHGAHKDRAEGGVGMELSDTALYGGGGNGGGDDARFAKHQKYKERRQEQQTGRIQVLQAKEEERKQNMLKMLGLDNLIAQQQQGGGARKKITIAPRNDSAIGPTPPP